jgi:transketolase
VTAKVQGFTWTVEDSNLITDDDVWGDALCEIGRRDPRVVALTADLGRSTKIGRFQKQFPDRFFNLGICEQNLIAVASGLAASGLIPVVSTYAVFASLRAAEFVRADLCYNRRAVKIVGTLAGVSFGQGGPTHHAVEDLALLRAFPEMTVIAPCDGYQAARALEASIDLPGPVYLRLGRGMEPPVHRTREIEFVVGRAVEMRGGSDVTVIACGVTLLHALRAAERVKADGVSVRVLDMHTIKPLDVAAVKRAIDETRRIITVEDHAIVGGLGSAVAEVIAESQKGCAFLRLGHGDRFSPMGMPEDLLHLSGIDEDGILAAIARIARVTIREDDDWREQF